MLLFENTNRMEKFGTTDHKENNLKNNVLKESEL